MSNITTVTVTIEVITTIEVPVSWEINDDEFREWAGHALADSHPQAVKDFLESGRYYDQEIKDHYAGAKALNKMCTDVERKIGKVVL